MKQFWHKPSGVALSAEAVNALVAEGSYGREDFEEARQFSPSRSLLFEQPVPQSPILQAGSPAGKRRRLR
jgi:hypothetical protein